MESNPEEKQILGKLEELDTVVQSMRNQLRYGEILSCDFEIKKI
ncbi:hypothetical protein HMPREF9466_03049 [Fusobacterium necrophorum subsp. funduliforme 1_1_36S]|nr:hypothetical protein HMPREF9466_03049 [Fusobacterium necrophorum subsp. funduliforme 1_1_36S]